MRQFPTNGRPMSRRQVMRGTAALAGAAAVELAGARPAGAQSDKVVSLLSWPGHGAQDVIAPFEAATGFKVQSKEYTGGEEMIALLQSSPPGTFDVVLSVAEYIQHLQN